MTTTIERQLVDPRAIALARSTAYPVALEALALGLCPVPPRGHGDKFPVDYWWRKYQTTPPTAEKIAEWYGRGLTGMGLALGVGGAECNDFDCRATYDEFMRTASPEVKAIAAKIEAGYCEDTPSGGVHWLFRCDEPIGTRKLARRVGGPGEHKVVTLIETKGLNSYVVTAPSHGNVHKTGKPYVLRSGSLATIADVTKSEAELFIEHSLTFDQMPKVEKKPKKPRDPNRVYASDAFSAKSDVVLLFEQAGWTLSPCGKRLKRPGDSGNSSHAEILANEEDGVKRVRVWTDSVDGFESGRSYDAFGAFAILKHKGDFKAAACELEAVALRTKEVPRRLVVVPPRSSWTPKLTAKEDKLYEDALGFLPPSEEKYVSKVGWTTIHPPGFKALNEARECRQAHNASDCDSHGAKGIQPHTCHRKTACLNCGRLEAERFEREFLETLEKAGITELGIWRRDVPETTQPQDLVRAVVSVEREMARCAPSSKGDKLGKWSRGRLTIKGYDHVLGIFDPREPDVDEDAFQKARDATKTSALSDLMNKQRRWRMSDFRLVRERAEAAGIPFEDGVSAWVLPVKEAVALIKKTMLSICEAFRSFVDAGDAGGMAEFPWLLAKGVHRPAQNKKSHAVMPWPSERVMAPKRRAAALAKRNGVPFSECETPIGMKDGEPCYCRKPLNQSAVNDRNGRVMAKRTGRPFWGPEMLNMLLAERAQVGSRANL